MSERKRILAFAILIMTAISIVVGAIVMSALYRTALEGQRQRLCETAQSQARLLESLAASNHDPATILGIIKQAHANLKGLGQTGEFSLARRDGETIVFLLNRRYSDSTVTKPATLALNPALPMARALAGQSGSLIGIDYRREPVLAAYEPVRALHWGIVAKIDLSEVRAPFVRTGILAGLGAIVVILGGACLFFRLTNPLIGRLEESEARNQAILDMAPDGIITTDAEGIIVSCNPAAERLFGCTAASVTGQPCSVLVPAFSRAESPRAMSPALPMTQPLCTDRAGEVMGRRCDDGTTFPMEMAVSEVHLGARRLFTGIVRDITARKQAEEALRQSEEQLRLVTDALPVCIAYIDAQQRYCFNNQTYETWFGYSKDQLYGKHMQEIIGHAAYAVIQPSVQTALTGQVVSLEQLVPYERAGTRTVHATFIPDIDLDGHVKGLYELLTDLTERKRLEDWLRQRHKMEAIGTLAGGIAHDFNNILYAIFGFTELALRSIPRDNPAYADLQEVLTAGNRAKDLVKQILTFSRQNASERRPLRLGLLIRETLKLLRASLPSTIDIRPYIGASAGMVLADPTQIHQVIMNLMSNAEYAMRATGGVLEVRLDDMHITPASIMAPQELPPGPYLHLTVRDTGCGIPPEVMARLFEPFFTTKAPGEGTGMGLAVAHGIIASHGGAITVSSAPEQGAAFEVYLPQFESLSPDEALPEESSPVGHARILFVDDEETLTRLAQGIFTFLGYDITVHNSGHAALAAFRAAPQHFDLVITDQTMPHMTGEELVCELRSIRSNIPIILCTGYSHLIDADKAQALGIDAFCLKPVQLRDLNLVIRQVLEQWEALRT